MVEIDRGVPAKRVDIVYRDLTKPDSYFDILIWGVDSRFTRRLFQGRVVREDRLPVAERANHEGRSGHYAGGVDDRCAGGPGGDRHLQHCGRQNLCEAFERREDRDRCLQRWTESRPARFPLTSIGSASLPSGRATDRYGYFSFESYIVPPTIYRLDTQTEKRDLFAQPKVPFDSSQYELKQVFYQSKDGTKVPMFIAGKKGLKQDGTERLLMTGYGGFQVGMTPEWNPAWAWWIQEGGWFALPNLRGGDEYGEHWHEQAMFEKKQNVFDDFFAAAEYLIANKYTSPDHFAIRGRSNGGLLMGAAITQRPDLFSAVWCGYPLLDMLRYQKFEQGPLWVTEYGSSDKEKQFDYLIKYSPYQNVKVGAMYPAVMFWTGSSDTRVDPMHARKMTALMQADSTSGRPVLLHYSVAGGHSEGVSVQQQIQDDTDELSFLWTETGQPPAHK